jgi:hypothetical protein
MSVIVALCLRVTDAGAKLLSASAIREPPVPVERLVRESGAVVSYQPFDAEDITGLYRAENATPVIGVNSNTAKVRRLAGRFEVSQQAMEYRLASLGMLTPS